MIDFNKQLTTNITLTMKFLKYAGEANLYVKFVYVPHKNYNDTQGQVLISMDADPMNAKCFSTTNDTVIKTRAPKEITSKSNVG